VIGREEAGSRNGEKKIEKFSEKATEKSGAFFYHN
jgi:hypothetical protein